MPQLIGYTSAGIRVGETHPHARTSSAVVAEVRRLHEEERVSYSHLARRFQVSRTTIAHWCRYRQREQVPAYWLERAA